MWVLPELFSALECEHMKGTALWIVVVLIVVAGAGFLVFRSVEPNNETSEIMEENTQDISFEDDTEVTEGISGGQFIQQEPVDSAPSGDVIISMTDTGFVPDEVIIAAGDTVTFVNDGQALHWPASDVHPTHEVLPEFDAKRGLATGETYSYIFDETGVWNFHDHLRASYTGTITVE